MFRFFRLWLGLLARCFRSHRTLLLENLALRQQLAVLKRRHPRARLHPIDKLFWVLARRFRADWKKSLLVVSPETDPLASCRISTVLEVLSRVKKQVGRKRLSKEIRDLIFRMVAENPTWGAPRIHGELLMLGFDVSERSISRWIKRAPQRSRTCPALAGLCSQSPRRYRGHGFLHCPNRHLQAAVLPLFISHDRRQILHVNVTRYPTSTWIAQQLREAFPYESAPRFLLFDHDQKYGLEVPAALRSLQITGVQTSIRSPWQNGVAERWVGSCRRDLLDHIIALNERHLNKLLADYVRYYHDDRTHLGLRKQTPGGRLRSAGRGRILSRVRLNGLHHRSSTLRSARFCGDGAGCCSKQPGEIPALDDDLERLLVGSIQTHTFI